MKKRTLLCAVFTLLSCMHQRRVETFVAATISVADERLSLSPLISEASIETLPDWPADPTRQKMLLHTLNLIWNELLAEFRRCEKFGFYTMVDDNDNPTFRISVVLTSVDLYNDTLSMPIRLQAERLRDDQRFIYTIPATAAIAPPKKDTDPFHYYGRLLAEYRRQFPYNVLVSFFYHHKLD